MNLSHTTPYSSIDYMICDTWAKPDSPTSSPVISSSTRSEMHSIRMIKNSKGKQREKYNGLCWKPVCTWGSSECNNFAVSSNRCLKHKSGRRRKFSSSHSPKCLESSTISPNPAALDCTSDNKDDIIFLGEFNTNNTTDHQASAVSKPEFNDFRQFSIESADEDDSLARITIEAEPSSHYNANPNNEIEYIGSKTLKNELNLEESISKQLPPLTDFEESILAYHLISQHPTPTSCSMLDAQLRLHKEAIAIVKKNYRIQVETISAEYFYDFLLRHPRVPIHFKHWFQLCKLTPPTTGSPIDMKVWTLGMMVRGISTYDKADNKQ